MRDRKRIEFEAFWDKDSIAMGFDGKSGPFTDESPIQFAWESWQVCQKINDKIIADLKAMVAIHREELQHVHDELLKDNWRGDVKESISDTLALKPGDVELVEVGQVVEDRLAAWTTPYLKTEFNFDGFIAGDKLYLLKQKEGK